MSVSFTVDDKGVIQLGARREALTRQRPGDGRTRVHRRPLVWVRAVAALWARHLGNRPGNLVTDKTELSRCGRAEPVRCPDRPTGAWQQAVDVPTEPSNSCNE